MSRAARIACALLGAVCAWGAYETSQRALVPAPAVLTTWEREHPDVFPLDEYQSTVFADKRAEKRRDDALWLLVGLAAGGLAASLAPRRLLDALGGPVSTALVAGAVATGGWAVVRSVTDQAERASDGLWTLGDDSLAIFASAHADTLRALRERIPEDHAVITIGRRDIELNLVAWSLHPRPIYPVIARPPAAMTIEKIAEELSASELATDHPGRWVLDLGRMALFSQYVGDMVVPID